MLRLQPSPTLVAPYRPGDSSTAPSEDQLDDGVIRHQSTGIPADTIVQLTGSS
jgi:hypothetical protein